MVKVKNWTKKAMGLVLALCVALTGLVLIGFGSRETKQTKAVDYVSIMNARAQQMADYRWTPTTTFSGWAGRYTFSAGGSYTIPYSQPYNNGGYVFYNLSLDSFESQIGTMKSGTTYGDGTTMPIRGMDCSSFCSFIYDLPSRCTTYTFFTYANNGTNGFAYGSMNTVKAGDLVNSNSHVRYVMSVSGQNVTTCEQTPNSGIDTVIKTYTKTYLTNNGYSVLTYDGRYIQDGDQNVVGKWSSNNGTYSISQGNCHVDEWGTDASANKTGQTIPYQYVTNSVAYAASYTTSAKFVNTYQAEQYQYGSIRFGYCPIYIDDNNWILVYCSWANDTSTTRMKSIELTGEIGGVNPFGGYKTTWIHDCDTAQTGNKALTPLQTASNLSSGYTINATVTKSNITITVNGLETHNVNVDLSAVVGKSNSKMALFAFWADLTVSNVTSNAIVWTESSGTYTVSRDNCHIDEWGNDASTATGGLNVPRKIISNSQASQSSFTTSAKFVNTYPAETLQYGSNKFGYCPLYIDENNWILVYCSWDTNISTTRMKSVELTGLINGTAVSAFGTGNYVSVWVHDCDTATSGNKSLTPLQTASTLSSGYTIDTTVTASSITIKVNGLETHNVSVDLSALTSNTNKKLALFSFWADLTVSNVSCAQLTSGSGASGSGSGSGSGSSGETGSGSGSGGSGGNGGSGESTPSVKTYTINFNKNGGSGTMSSLTATVGQSKKLSKNTFTREGFVFKGWATSANGAVVYADELSVTDLASENGTVTLYAVWEAETTSGSGSTNDSNTNGNTGTNDNNQSSGGGCFGSVDVSSVALTVLGLGAVALIGKKLVKKENGAK